LRDWDVLGRVGGEEFAVVLPETASEQSLQVAERLRHAVATTGSPLESGESAHITVSIGVATVHDEDTNLDTLLQRADQALYEAKRTGRDKVCLAKG
jgi:diguanylate cyclase (GGDEF)-like protein